MTVVDAHVHLFRAGSLPSAWYEIGAQRWAHSVWPPRSSQDIDIEGGLVDDDASRLVAAMDEAGVDVAICMALDWGVSLGEPTVPIPVVHEWYSQLQSKLAGRFYAVAGVDPRRPDAVRLLDDALGRLSLRGLKLYPPTGYFASDPVCFPLYEKCLEFDVPVVIHTAFVGYPHRGHYANPLQIGEVQARYPDLKIVLAHSGFPFWNREAVEIVSHHPTSYLELSNWNLILADDEPTVSRALLEMVKRVGAHRVIYASDHLGGRRFSGSRSQMGVWKDFVGKMPAWAESLGAAVSINEMELIMGANAIRVFGLPEHIAGRVTSTAVESR